MALDSKEKDKEQWLQNEKRIRLIIIGLIVCIIFLTVVIVFFRTQVWGVITGLALIVGLIVDIITLIKMKKGD